MASETISPLEFSPPEKRPGDDNPVLAAAEAAYYESLHLVTIQVEVFIATGFGVRYLRGHHILAAGVSGAVIVAALGSFRVPGWPLLLAVWAAGVGRACVHAYRARAAEIVGRPLSEHTRFSGQRWLIHWLVQALQWPSSAVWIHRLWEPLAVASCAAFLLVAGLLFLPNLLVVGAWLGFCAVALSLKAEYLYARYLETIRDLQDAECQARVLAAERNARLAAREERYYEVTFAAEPAPEEADPDGEVSSPPATPPTAREPTPGRAQGRIRGRCGRCKCNLDLAASLVGKKLRCPQCQRPFTVPAPRVAA